MVRLAEQEIDSSSVSGVVLNTVIPVAALYAALFVSLLAMNAAIVVRLRSVIPQSPEDGADAVTQASIGRFRIVHRKD
jgi:hypothetical protein